MKREILILLALISCPAVPAQTGGIYHIEKSVIASGSTASSSGIYSLENTSGQAATGGPVQGPSYRLYVGFWAPSLAPTAANVSVGGRVLTAAGQTIRARVTLNASNGTIRSASTNSFGYYRFDEVPVGEAYILTVSSKGFVFTNPTQVVVVNDEITDLDFIGVEQ